MSEEKDVQAEQALLREAARARILESERMQQAIEEATSDPAVKEEWIRQSNLIYGGLAGAGLVVVQPFLTSGPLDLSATVCVVAFAIAIPLLAALIVLNWQEQFRRQESSSKSVTLAKSIAQGSAFVGLAAAFWHISMTAGIAFLTVAVMALAVHSSGYTKLEYDAKWRSKFHRRKSPES